jgi:hypothetical protein
MEFDSLKVCVPAWLLLTRRADRPGLVASQSERAFETARARSENPLLRFNA